MNRIQKAFEKGKAFIPFVTGGDPDLATTKELLIAMAEEGADLIEIGIPFSDPVAEGPTIQAANERALKAGCTIDKLFDMIKETRKRVTVPMVFLTYINPIFVYGKSRFMKRCVECGIDGLIIPDLPYEEKHEILDVCEEYDIILISLIAPTSNERIKMIAKEAKGFVYVVSSLGVTGVRQEIKTDTKAMIELVKAAAPIPCAVGFGISTPQQAKEQAEVADGVIVGSAIVRLLEEYQGDSVKVIREYVREMKNKIS
jgi:tryptophan synthase, alpha subunit